jgi:hypothetical protein
MWRWVDSRAAMGGSKPKDAEQSLNPVRCSKRSWLVAKVITELSRGFQLPHLRRSNRDLHGGKKFDNIISSSSHPKKRSENGIMHWDIADVTVYINIQTAIKCDFLLLILYAWFLFLFRLSRLPTPLKTNKSTQSKWSVHNGNQITLQQGLSICFDRLRRALCNVYLNIASRPGRLLIDVYVRDWEILSARWNRIAARTGNEILRLRESGYVKNDWKMQLTGINEFQKQLPIERYVSTSIRYWSRPSSIAYCNRARKCHCFHWITLCAKSISHFRNKSQTRTRKMNTMSV